MEKKLIVTLFVIATAFGCSYFEGDSKPGPVDEILFQWNVEEGEQMAWHPTNKSHDIYIFKGARAADPDELKPDELREFTVDDIETKSYVLITYEENDLVDKTITLSWKGVLTGKGGESSDRVLEVPVQKISDESWEDFYKRAFKKLVENMENPSEDDSTLTQPPKLRKRADFVKAEADKPEPDTDADTDAGTDDAEPEEDEEDDEERLLEYPSFFDWQPGIHPIQALTYHPYVVDGLDKVILHALTNLNVIGEDLFRLNVEDFNELTHMIIFTYSPENLKDGKVVFKVRTIEEKERKGVVELTEKFITVDIKRGKKKIGKDKETGEILYRYEDWQDFYERGICKVLKNAKIIKNCKSQKR